MEYELDAFRELPTMIISHKNMFITHDYVPGAKPNFVHTSLLSLTLNFILKCQVIL